MLGYLSEQMTFSPYQKIRTLSEKIINSGANSNQVATLERLIRSVSDRGTEAIFFCDCSILFRKKGEDTLHRKMIQNAIRQARIIRPLSRRAYIMADIAMKISAAGCEQIALEVLDSAIDAATNIRQSSLRDEVFDELGLSMRIIQEM